MAFIPIIAKADIEQSKKGKISPAQMAQEIAFALQRKTGIFNIAGRRCEATASTPSNNKSTITFDAGYIVICGRLVEVELGTTLDIDTPVSGSEEGYIIAKFDLSSVEENEFTVTAVPSTHALVQQDLNDNPVGTYEFVLYSYVATPSSVTLTRSDNIYLDPMASVVNMINNNISTINNNISTINTRLENLGFKQGGVGGYVNATLKRTGNYVLAEIRLNQPRQYETSSPLYGGGLLVTLPQNFRPKYKTDMSIGGQGSVLYNNELKYPIPCTFDLTIQTNGEVRITKPIAHDVAVSVTHSVRLGYFVVYAGFEANPIT